MKKIHAAVLLLSLVVLTYILLSSYAPTEGSNDLDLMYYCDSAADCVPVECGCDCSGCGGFSYDDIINRAYVDQWYSDNGCAPAKICPEVCCEPKKVACEEHVCKVYDLSGQGGEPSNPSKPTESDCAVEGQQARGPEFPCCEGLETVDACIFDIEEECLCMDHLGVCSDCGDGICGEYENICNCEEDCKSNLEIHEWGVLSGCQSGDDFFLTSRPEISAMVKQPVVYVHAKGIDSIDAEFTFQDGEVTDTYPEGDVAGAKVSWKNVGIGSAIIKGSKAFMMPRVDIEDLIPTLNDVDSDDLNYKGQESRFLFYEGEMQFTNNIEVDYDAGSETATFVNRGNYPVYNLILAHNEGGYMRSKLYYATLDRLDAGEEREMSFIEQDLEGAIYEDMKYQGFTDKETNAFVRIWEDQFLVPTNLGFTQLIYRLPQEEYDEMITAKITPNPDKFLRTMYVQVKIDEPGVENTA